MGTEAPLAPVVVCVDRASSGAAVEFGAAVAVCTSRPLELVHVAPLGDEWLATIGRDALRVAGSRANAHLSGRGTLRSSLLRGDVVTELARAVDAAALVVLEQLPPLQQRRSSRAVTVELGGRVDVSLVVVPADWVALRRSIVTVGFDPVAPDDTALRAAVIQARLRTATLRVVVAGSRGDVDERLAALGADACDVAVEEIVGDSASALRNAGLSSDLVVVGRHVPSASGASRLGSVGRAVLVDPPCPVLLTMPGHEHDGTSSAADVERRAG